MQRLYLAHTSSTIKHDFAVAPNWYVSQIAFYFGENTHTGQETIDNKNVL